MFNKTKLENGAVKISTKGIDYLHDRIEIYCCDKNYYTDDGYIYAEYFPLIEDEEQLAIDKMQQVAKTLNIEFDLVNKEFYVKNADEEFSVTRLIQAYSVVSWIIHDKTIAQLKEVTR